MLKTSSESMFISSNRATATYVDGLRPPLTPSLLAFAQGLVESVEAFRKGSTTLLVLSIQLMLVDNHPSYKTNNHRQPIW